METWNARIDRLLAQNQARPVALAKAVGVSQATVSNWLSGEIKKISADHLLRAAKFLRADPYWILFGEGMPACMAREDSPNYATMPPIDLWSELGSKLNSAAPKNREAIGQLLLVFARNPESSSQISQAIESLLSMN